MNAQLHEYIESARSHGHDDAKIKTDLTGGGWDAGMVEAALSGKDDGLAVPPPPPAGVVSGGYSQPQAPIAVVQQMSTRGFEYIILFLSLGFTAVSLGVILHNAVDAAFGNAGVFDGFVSYAASALIVSLPIFAFLFLRLKRAEQADPNLRHDPSRRKSIQLTLVVAFLWGIIKVITYVYSLLNGANAADYAGSGVTSPIGNLLHTLVTLGIAGGIFVYYWIDEHRTV